MAVINATYNTIVINNQDNVATALVQLHKGDQAVYSLNGKDYNIQIIEDIPFGHKICIHDISKDAQIIKYGETIGGATKNIQQGQYIHVHNLESLRARGDKN